jgi:hypothetical protein
MIRIVSTVCVVHVVCVVCVRSLRAVSSARAVVGISTLYAWKARGIRRLRIKTLATLSPHSQRGGGIERALNGCGSCGMHATQK